VLSALRQTVPGSELVRPLTAAPDSGGWAIVERLLTDLAPLPDQLWLVIDDLSAPEIAGELSLSTSTVKTHMRNLYGKLGAHSRTEAVQSGRVLGLLAPPARQR
jgi:ATP/maltotriose-dependent transcriptional regulator MalT